MLGVSQLPISQDHLKYCFISEFISLLIETLDLNQVFYNT